jgi:tetratricopeptide (TPR) repeat protein
MTITAGLLVALILQSSLLDDYLKAQQAFAENPKSETAVVGLSSVLYQLHQTQKGIALLQPFVRSNPQAHRAKIFLALGHVREEKYEQARVLAAQVAAVLPKDHYVQHVLGLSLAGLNRFDTAEARFKQAIEIKPDFADAHFQLGLLYSRSPDSLEQAAAAFQRAIETGFRSAETYKDLASVQIKLNRYDEAVEQLRTALQLDPNYADAYFLLADAFRKAGNSEQASAAAAKFQELNASETDRKQRELKAQALYQQGMELLSKDDFTRAYQTFRGAIEVSPALDIGYYRLAQIDYMANRITLAAQSINRALDLNPYEGEYYFVLARCLEGIDITAATTAAARAIALSPGTADFHHLLGSFLEKVGELERAVQSYQRATELDPSNIGFRRSLTAARQKLPRKP